MDLGKTIVNGQEGADCIAGKWDSRGGSSGSNHLDECLVGGVVFGAAFIGAVWTSIAPDIGEEVGSVAPFFRCYLEI